MTALHDVDAERGYLCAVLADNAVLDVHPVSTEDFFGPSTRTMFQAASWLRSEGETIDLVSLRHELARTKKLGYVGGDMAVDELAGAVGLSLNPEATRTRLRSLSALRARREALAKAVGLCDSGDLAAVDAAITELASRTGDLDEKPESLFACATGLFQDMAARKTSSLIPTTLEPVDAAVGGLSPGALMVIGADTGVGKTGTLLAMAIALARSLRKRVGIISCEDGRDVVGTRAVGFGADVDGRLIRRGVITPEQWARLAHVVDGFRNLPIELRYCVGGDDVDVCAAMGQLVSRGAEIVMVDYLQTINSSTKSDVRREAIRQVASRLKGRAFRLGVPLVLTSQLTRPGKDQVNREPSRHDLKESGDIENMAELIVMLWRPDATQVNRVAAKIDKSKWGGDGMRWEMVRKHGVLVEVNEGSW